MSINRISVQTSMQPFIPLPHPHPQRSNKIIIQQQLFPQKEPPPQPLFPKKFMCISFIFSFLCDFPLCHFYLFWRKAENMYVHLCFNFFFFCFYFILLYKTKFGYKLQKKNRITSSKANNIDVLLQLNLHTNILDYVSKKFVLLN